MLASSIRYTRAGIVLAALGLVATSQVTAGCGTSAASLCERSCECSGCSETERTDCVDALGDAEKLANDKGCGEQYSAWASCLDDQLRCVDDKIDADGCETEAEALVKCTPGITLSVGGLDNVGACNAWVEATKCGSTDIASLVNCDLYKDTDCNISGYFDCLVQNTKCENDVLDATGWGSCASKAVCE